jgi:hypothetical protein
MISSCLKLLLFMGLWLSVLSEADDVITTTDSQNGEMSGREMGLIREPFPFSTFSLLPVEGNSTLLLSFPVPAFSQQVNVSITIDEPATPSNDSQVKPTRAEQGLMRAEQGPTRAELGPTRAELGPTRAEQGLLQLQLFASCGDL